MAIWRNLQSWLSWFPWYRRQAREADLARELRDHLELEADEQRAAGLSPEQAACAAHRALGSTLKIQEDVRAAWGFQRLETFVQDVRYAFRGVVRAPFLSLTVVLALATGVGLNAAIFALLDSSWLQPPVEKNPSTFVRIIPSYSGWFETENLFPTFTVRDYNAIRSRVKSLHEVAAYTRVLRAALGEDRSANTGVGLVTCNFFDVYSWGPPLRGRLFLPQECAADSSAPVAIMNENLWRNRYSSNPHIIGKVIRIDQHPYTVVGLVNVQTVPWMREDLWVPYTMTPAFFGGNDVFRHTDSPAFFLAGRLNAGYSRAAAQAELQVIENDQDRLIPGRKTTVHVTNGSLIQDPNTRSIGLKIIPLILGPMALILLVACTDVTMLLLARAAGRRGEMAIRLTLGAGRGRLLRMLASEGLLIAAAAGVLGAYAADKLPATLWTFLLSQSDFQTVGPDWRVFAFLAVITLIAGCLAGAAPARESLKVNLVESLKGQEGASTARSLNRSILIIAQIAMSFVLVAAGVLFIRLQHSIASSDPGFETRQLFLVPLKVSAPHYTAGSAAAFYRTVRERVHEIAGVRSVSYTDTPPFTEPPDSEIRLPGETKGQGQRAVVEQVSTDFFSTMKIRIVRGRAFRNSDATGNRGGAVAVVSQTFARNYWSGVDPLGKVVLLPDGTRLLIVGVAADVESSNFDTPDEARLYVPQSPRAFTGFLLVRFEGPANSIGAEISRSIHSLDSTQTGSPLTLQSMRDEKAAHIRPLTELILFMAIVAVVLALSGLYGTVAFSMSQRTREFGIRMALGASKERILRSVLRTSARQIGIGLLFGVALALPAAFAFRGLIGGGTSRLFDWSTYAAAALALASSALIACYVPARRAMRLDPMTALRHE